MPKGVSDSKAPDVSKANKSPEQTHLPKREGVLYAVTFQGFFEKPEY